MSRKKALLPTPVKEMIISWHLERKSLREIAQLTGRSHSTVQSIVKKWKDTECLKNQWC